MVQLLAVVFSVLLISHSSFATVVGTNNVWQVGGAANSTFPSAIIPFDSKTFELTATQLSAFGGGTYMGFYKAGPGGNAQYNVPVTDTATVCSGMYYSANANNQVSLGAADGTTTDGGSAPSGFFPYEKVGAGALSIQTNANYYWMPGYWQFQSGKYPTLYTASGTVNASYRLICKEQP